MRQDERSMNASPPPDAPVTGTAPKDDPDASPHGRLGPVLHPLYVRGMALAKRAQGRTFGFQGALYPYFAHHYNETWRNERAVEVPLARAQLRGEVLEVGNVLAHYDPHVHTVIDLYEPAPDVLNVDVVDYVTDRRFDTIVAISTLEHVGFDEATPDPGKPRRAVEHLAGLLAPGGTLWVSVPLGYNPAINELMAPGAGVFDRVAYLQRVSADNRWQEASWAQVEGSVYGQPFLAGNAIAVATLSR
jgi:SAM-dependent methyltransferase